MLDKQHLNTILVSLTQASHNVRFLDQILAQTITRSLPYSILTVNCLVRAFSNCPAPSKAFLAYKHLYASIRPDRFTFPSLLKASSRLSSVPLGIQIHAHVLKRPLVSDVYVANALVHFYGTVALLNDARLVFDAMPERDTASWNSLLGAYNTNRTTIPHWLDEIMILFRSLMRGSLVRADKITLVILLSACPKVQTDNALVYGIMIHACAMKLGFGSVQNVNNALIDLYCRFKQMDEASMIFHEMGFRKDVVSYTVLINGYVEIGLVDLAGEIFHQIVNKDIVLWNLMVHAYIKANRPMKALQLFTKMEKEGVVPDENTVVSLLAACSSLLDLKYGRLVHVFVSRNNVKQDVYVKTALIDMYFKCGCVDEALVVFYKMEYKDVVAWSVVIGGLASHGFGGEALGLFNRMEGQGIRPNESTFVSVLMGCSHSGLVREACLLFKKMAEVYKIQPNIEHFGCLIDVLSRAGLLHQAEDFVKLLREDQRLVAYKSLLSACIEYSEIDLGKKVAKEIRDLSSGCETPEANILLSNFYAVAGQWGQVVNTRTAMKRLGVRKEPGISCV